MRRVFRGRIISPIYRICVVRIHRAVVTLRQIFKSVQYVGVDTVNAQEALRITVDSPQLPPVAHSNTVKSMKIKSELNRTSWHLHRKPSIRNGWLLRIHRLKGSHVNRQGKSPNHELLFLMRVFNLDILMFFCLS